VFIRGEIWLFVQSRCAQFQQQRFGGEADLRAEPADSGAEGSSQANPFGCLERIDI
jgi:hypothetical protein